MSDEYDWREDARCAETDPDAFFPVMGGVVLPVKKICRSCPVAAQCLQFANDNFIVDGIWGGYSPMERRRMRRNAA